MNAQVKRWLPLFIVLLLLAAFAASFTLEKRDRDLGYSSEAQLNPWLAAGRVLEKQGLHIRFAPAYGSLPTHAQVIVLATPLEYLDAQEQVALLAWVRAGGHLVTELQSVSYDDEAPDESELLYKTLGVKLRELEEENHAAPASKPGKNGLRVTRLAEEGEVQTGLDADYFLEAGPVKPLWAVSMAGRDRLLRFRLGDGHITVASDLYWMQNRALGAGDHAALLWRMVDAKAGATVWLIHGEERPSLFALLRQKATPLLQALALFVLVWLWQVSRRFGPVQAPAENGRRRLSEHLEASGRYLLRHNAVAKLQDASRQRLLSEVQRRYPQWRRLPPEKLAEHLAQRAGLESGAILRVLGTDAPDNLLQFAADIRLLNRLRKAL